MRQVCAADPRLGGIRNLCKNQQAQREVPWLTDLTMFSNGLWYVKLNLSPILTSPTAGKGMKDGKRGCHLLMTSRTPALKITHENLKIGI